MIRTLTHAISGTALALAIASPASAQVVQSFQVGFGGFFPRSFESRAQGDVLVENLTAFEPLLFEVSDFRGANVFGEWTVAFGHHIEVGAGISHYQRTAPSIYRDVVNITGREIEQDLKLRVVPVTALVRFLPFGRMGNVQPFIGAGVAALNWRYSEVGEFVDTFDYSVFEGRYLGKGTTVAPVVLGGLRVPIKGDIYAMNLEWRYQFGEGDLGLNNGFLSDKIDLAGGNFNLGFLIRF